MADNLIGITIKGYDQASSAIADVDKKVSGLGNTASVAKGTLAGILTADVISRVADFGVKVAGAVVELGKMGEESVQEDAHFQAIAGGAANAAERLREMGAAVGDYLTVDQQMAASTRIMSLGLADSATAAGELARTAITLGDSTQTAEQRLQSFTQILATGRTTGLAQFGISVIAVRQRVEELTAADESLSKEMATQQAITEAAAERMALLGDYMPVSKTEQMAVKVADLKDKLGDLVAQPYIISVEFLTTGIENIISLLNRTSNDSAQQLQGIDSQIANAQAELEKMKGASGQGILGGLFNQKYSDEQLAVVQKNIDELIAKQQYLQGATAEAGDVGVAALDKQSSAAILLKDNLQKVEDQLAEVEGAAGSEAGGATDKTQVDAAGLVKNLQKGLFSPEVIGAIDVDKLAAEPGMAGLARKSFEAFGKAMADNKGGANIADMLIGFQADEKGVSPADTAAEKAVNTLSAAIGAQVTGKDFAGKMIGYGETIWGYTETGMLNKAKASTAFAAAIDAMVAASIANALQ